MYPVGDVLPVDELDSGSFLLSGPAMSGKYELLLDLLLEGVENGEGVLVVTTNDGAGEIFGSIEERRGSVPERFRVVDAVSDAQGTTVDDPGERVEHVSSPGDLTGLGIGTSEQLRRLVASDSPGVRIGVDSVSTLFMYTELETVFRFMHVLTGRIDAVDGLGLFTIDPTTHEEREVNTLKQLFDGMIEFREAEGGGREIRVVGVPDVPDGWTARP